MKFASFHLLGLALTLAGGLLIIPLCVQAQDAGIQETNRAPASSTKEVSPELMHTFLYLQEQVHAMQMAVERSRLQAEAAALRNADTLDARLQVIEKALSQAREDSSLAVQEAGRQIRESNRQVMLLAGVFASIGFLALAATAWLQWKTASRLHTVPPSVGLPALFQAPGYGAWGLRPSVTQGANVQLMDALGRLEHRIADLEVEHQAHPPIAVHPGTDSPATGSTATGELAALIREGEELLAHEESEKAIAHFDAVLARHPGHPEVLLRKGEALERLKRDQEAIDCYDQAIRADKTLTMAYLHKGGLYNRMERFSEAMECYEQALKVQERRTEVT